MCCAAHGFTWRGIGTAMKKRDRLATQEMGSSLSKLSLTMFEFANEVFVAVGAGLTGIALLFLKGGSEYTFMTGVVLALAVLVLYHAFQDDGKVVPDKHKIVFITGCDSGLGYSLALHLNEIGFRVLAGVLNRTSEGARALSELDDVRIVQVDITSDLDVQNAYKVLNGVCNEDESNGE